MRRRFDTEGLVIDLEAMKAAIPKRLLVRLSVSGLVLLMAACRAPAPVAQHFLRIPAEAAGGLSAIHRAEWLKSSKRSLPSRRQLAATGHLVMPGTSTRHGTVLRGLEMLYIPGPDRAGGIAVITHPGDKLGALPELHLFTCDRLTYVPALPPLAPYYWRVEPDGRRVTGYSVSVGPGSRRQLTPRTSLIWSGTSWQTHPASGPPIRVE